MLLMLIPFCHTYILVSFLQSYSRRLPETKMKRYWNRRRAKNEDYIDDLFHNLFLFRNPNDWQSHFLVFFSFQMNVSSRKWLTIDFPAIPESIFLKTWNRMPVLFTSFPFICWREQIWNVMLLLDFSALFIDFFGEVQHSRAVLCLFSGL